MTIGIIIVFRNSEHQIVKGNFFKECIKYQNIDICLVNNASTDKTLLLLKEIQEEFQSHVEVLDIKKYTSTISAVKAGERYFTNSQNLKHIGYICIEDISDGKALDDLLTAFIKNNITSKQLKTLPVKYKKPTFLKNIFSVLDNSKFIHSKPIK